MQGITILAPIQSPNTDGINPDSCSNTRIEDTYIISGDDCVAVKSGWDEYGISYGMPTQHLIIRRLTCISPYSAAIALGSEMSGDTFKGICISNATIGMRVKAKKVPWTCTDIEGVTSGVVPKPCDLLPDQGQHKIGMCTFPQDKLEIDKVELKKCSYVTA
nr:probable polygalacturonase [Tanacetum cinerariifolium]